MSVFRELLPASYRGVRFLVPSESKEGGKKTVSHEYPGSNRRFVEELGTIPGKHSIVAIIHGNDAIQQRRNLEEALIQPGRGLLIHPILGQIMVVATNYTSRSSDTDLGKFTFDISFSESEENLTLSPGISSNQLISSLRSQGNGFLDLAFVAQYESTTFPDILQASSTHSTDLVNEVLALSRSITAVNETNLSSLSRTVNSVLNILPVSVRTGSVLSGNFRNIYNIFDSVSTDISEYFNLYNTLTLFGNDRTAKPQITAKRITEEINLAAIEDHARLNGLMGMYEGAVYTNYATDIDLLADQATLEEKYNTFIQEAPDDSLAYNPDVRRIINEMRVRSRDVFEERLQNIWRVVDIDPNEASIALTSYRYYGSFDQLNALINLNPKVNVSVFNETLRGLT